MSSYRLALALAGIAALSACRRTHGEDPVGTTTMTVATLDGLLPNEATEKLVEARCNQEQLCGEIGMKATTSSRGCADDVRSAIGDVLIAECPQGVSRPALDACAAALRAEPCGGALLAKTLPEPCRVSTLCVLGVLAR